MTFMLVSASILNTLYLFTRTKTYFLNLASEPVSSPHASFIKRPRTPHRSSSDDLVPRRSVPALLLALLGSLFSALWRGLVLSTRFLLNLSPPKARAPQPWEESERVQQLEVWTPGALEMALFSLYSPVHSLLWIATTSANWMLTFFIMFIVGVQVCDVCAFSCGKQTCSYSVLPPDSRTGPLVRGVAQGPCDHRCGGYARIRREGLWAPISNHWQRLTRLCCNHSLSTHVSIPCARTRRS